MLRAMSFNVRVDTDEDDPSDEWPEREATVASVVRLHAPDLVGLQEALAGQFAALRERLPDYEWIGVGRRDGASDGEHVPIGHADRFERLDSGTFWLSEAPGEAGSVGWDASLPRIATWARLRDGETGTTVLFCNTHFDHRGEVAREESARLLAERLPSVADGAPIVLTGDFNCEPGSTPYETLTEQFTDAKAAADHPHHGPTGTFHGFGGDPDGRIDYVFVDGGVSVRQHATLTDRWDGGYPSDHFPVLAECEPGA
ncbi:MAG: endonuclease/exonuclease/phosphatase family protein [Halobacteriales archaeon]